MTLYDFKLTIDELCIEALRKTGVLGQGEVVVDSLMLLQARQTFNLMVKSMANDHAAPWSFVTFEAIVSPGGTTPAFNYVEQGMIFLDSVSVTKDGTNDSYPLPISNIKRYLEELDRTETGEPEYVYAEAPYLKIYPEPDATYKLILYFLREWYEMETGQQVIQHPNRWYKCLLNGLCYDLGSYYGLPDYMLKEFSLVAQSEYRVAKRRDKQADHKRKVGKAF